jgi:NADH-quinone oxidoreductase subunit G
MITIFVDNKPYQVKEGQNLLQACLSLGFDLPYFCWHPAMHSVGACRQCAVKLFKDENDTRGRIVMSCMTPVAEGMRLSVDDPDARAFRSSVIEWLMLNHPHDCPVCDEGGECHLQDMTVMTGHGYRRTRFKKRTHRNQNLGPFINHEMNRCIQCYRCVRFYRDYAGGRDFDVFASHDHVYFGRHEDGVLENEFSGNLVEVCPTGVFTDKSLKRHYTRKWDLQTAPSVCVHCGIGCNTIPGERYGALRRILNRYNHDVNGYFLCDRGRYGYEFVNSGKRVRRPLIKTSLSPGGRGLGEGEQQLQPTSKETSLRHISDILTRSKRMIGIGSPRASLESNFALRTLAGPDNFYSGMSSLEHKLFPLIIDILQKGPARTPSLHDIETADAVLVLGEDVTNTAPMLALALRQSVRQKAFELAAKMKLPLWDDHAVRNAAQEEKSPLYIASYAATKLDNIAAKTYRAEPDDIARLGFAVAHELNPDAMPVSGLTNELRSLAKEIAAALKNAERPLIVSGTGCMSEMVIQAAATVAWALCAVGKNAEICFAVHECNSMGLGLMGGKSLNDAFNAAQDGKADTVIILENDLYRRAEEKTVNDFLSCVKHVIVIDHLLNPTSSKAAIALPAGTFAESDGTLVNKEGRAQRFYQVLSPDLDIQESWKWIRDIMAASGRKEARTWQSLDDITNDMTSALPIFKPVQDIAPLADYRIAGQKIPRQPHRYSGRTAMLANISVHEPKPPEDPDSPLSFSMEGYEGQPPAPFITRYWSPGWNSVQALNKFQQETGGPLRGGDPGKRLIEPDTLSSSLPSRGGPEHPLPRERAGVRGIFGAAISFSRNVPEAFKPKEDEWLVVPLYHVFGSEELSVLSPGIAERTPKPYLALNPEDARRIQVHDGEMVELSLAAIRHQLRIHVLSGLPAGVAGLGANLSVALGYVSPVFGNIRKK